MVYMGRISVLSMKKKLDFRGEYFSIMMNLDDKIIRCFLRSELERNELLRRLHLVSNMDDLYSIDEKAVLYIA
jgi:hypothetical protein